MVDPQSLKEGQPYFIVMFRDQSLLIPVILTVLFQGADTTDEGGHGFHFQRADDDENGHITLLAEDLEELVFDREGLIGLLQSRG
jgi:hypothetical protein